ncbi:hypothetical protein, conserved [Angomonas deanei]|uniref:Uncharacterized protein n=1 Tax=Angomonas deanei TaxID=59799 RepID=A0A7G2CI44_9TRYP|nr:hypothetical protein, conserved [Angomonas deanei]
MSLTEETMRRNGRICDAEVDLVGGVCSGMAPEKRKMLYEIVTCGLRGERWTAPAAVPPSAEKEERQLNLFAEEGVQDEETMEDLFKVSSGSDNEEA